MLASLAYESRLWTSGRTDARNDALQIVDIDMGCGVPLIHNLQAMPSPSSAIWPQLLLDFEYEGKLLDFN